MEQAKVHSEANSYSSKDKKKKEQEEEEEMTKTCRIKKYNPIANL